MTAANEGSPRLELRHALAGLQAGVAGALVMLACLMIGSLFVRRSIWVVPNLLATTFYGSEAYRNQLLRTSWSGAALIVVVYGILGVAWGCFWRDRPARWRAFFGALFGLAVYFVFYGFAWKHINPLVTLYAPDRQLELAHILFGLVLARSSAYSRRIADARLEPAVHDPETVLEVRSGEVIR